MSHPDFILRPMQPGDIEAGLRLSSEEGWNQTKKDWELLIRNPGNLCTLIEYKKKIIGTTTVMNYSNQVAWIGMVLVDKLYRRRGVSKLLLSDTLEKLKACESIKLDATPQGQQVYKNFDFKDEFLIVRMVNPSMKILPHIESDIELLPITEKHIREIISLDELIFGVSRVRLIESITKEFPGKAWLLKRNNTVAGFVLGRKGVKYHQIGPLIASNTTDAKILISQALVDLTDHAVVADVLGDKEELVDWLKLMGFSAQRNFVRMYKKANPFPGVIENQFLICGPEFG